MRKKSKIEQIATIIKKAGRVVLQWHNPIANDQRMEFFNDNVDRKVVITYKIITDVKSKAQMGFYRGAILPAICNATGDMDSDRVHDALKEMFITNVESVFGLDVHRTISLSKLGKPEMSEFINNCLNFLSDAGGHIDEQKFDEYESLMLGDIEGQTKTITEE